MAYARCGVIQGYSLDAEAVFWHLLICIWLMLLGFAVASSILQASNNQIGAAWQIDPRTGQWSIHPFKSERGDPWCIEAEINVGDAVAGAASVMVWTEISHHQPAVLDAD